MTINDLSSAPHRIITPKVLNDFEKVRQELCKRLQNDENKEKIKGLFNDIAHIKDGTILDVLYEVCELLTPEFYMSIDSQLFFSQKQLGEGKKSTGEISEDTFRSLQNLVVPAVVDIFYLVCLYINSGINKQKLKGLLHLNMQYGGGTGINTLFGENENIMFNNNWEESYNALRGNTSIYPQDEVDISKVGKETKDYVTQTVCPFRYNQKRSDFIDKLWVFFEIEILPLLQENFRDSNDTYEMFFSGNLGNILQKKPSK